ncbi:MAG TPA: hypothetical protein PK668_05510 [Myxococcota bacterium]|nr:hypothetical protein [Myxococcota bacterium]HRY92703.1 hypothetical protein [Myxococcota bacterium]HSA21527.1 hypothetical protein [Myxococcota bacterium]
MRWQATCGRRARRAARASLACLAGLLGLQGCTAEPPAGLVGKYGFERVAFVRRAHAPHAGSPLAEPAFAPGGDAALLMTAAPGAAVRSLTGGLDADVRGLDLSPDGERALVGLRTAPQDRYHVVEIDLTRRLDGDACLAEGGDLGPACRQLTFGPADDLEPQYLPDGRVAFLRQAPDGPVDFLGRGRALELWAVEADGTRPVRLSFTGGRLLGARGLPDGWVLGVAWSSRAGLASLTPVRLDPSGARGLRVDGPAPDPGAVPLGAVRDAYGQLVAACSALGGTWEAGSLCMQAPEGGWLPALSGIPAGVGCSPEGRLRDPWPLAEGLALVSYAKVPDGCMNAEDELDGRNPDFALAIVDRVTGARFPLASDAARDELWPRPVLERSLLDAGVSLPARPELGCATPGVVLEGVLDEATRSAGAVGLRVLVGLDGSLAPWDMELGGLEPATVCTGDGDGDGLADSQSAPVEADGSFRLRAPAGQPLRVQAVDAYGAALAQDPIWRDGPDCGRRSCGACHANGGEAPGFAASLAAARAPSPLDAPAADRRAFDFRADIQPLLDRSCAVAGCHDAQTAAGAYVDLGGQLRGLDLSATPQGRRSTAYADLLSVDVRREEASGRVLESRRPYVTPGRARESRLLQRLGVPCRWACAGAEAWAPWGVPEARRHPEDQAGAAPGLTDEERWRLVEWVDAGAPFHGAGAAP